MTLLYIDLKIFRKNKIFRSARVGSSQIVVLLYLRTGMASAMSSTSRLPIKITTLEAATPWLK